jgi:hypothetical protein
MGYKKCSMAEKSRRPTSKLKTAAKGCCNYGTLMTQTKKAPAFSFAASERFKPSECQQAARRGRVAARKLQMLG